MFSERKQRFGFVKNEQAGERSVHAALMRGCHLVFLMQRSWWTQLINMQLQPVMVKWFKILKGLTE